MGNGVMDVGMGMEKPRLPMAIRTLVNTDLINVTVVEGMSGMTDVYMMGTYIYIFEDGYVCSSHRCVNFLADAILSVCSVKINDMVAVILYGPMVPPMKGK